MKEEQQKLLRNIFRVLVTLVCVGYISIIFIDIFNYWIAYPPLTPTPPQNVLEHNYTIGFWNTLGIMTAICGAAFMIGGFIGFLFGIPKINQTIEDLPKQHILQNDNLVEISDWITKIIVGVSLTQLNSFPGTLAHWSEVIGSKANLHISPIAVGALIVFYIIAGFSCAYFWTRIYFAKILELNFSDTTIINKQLNVIKPDDSVTPPVITQQDDATKPGVSTTTTDTSTQQDDATKPGASITSTDTSTQQDSTTKPGNSLTSTATSTEQDDATKPDASTTSTDI